MTLTAEILEGLARLYKESTLGPVAPWAGIGWPRGWAKALGGPDVRGDGVERRELV